MPRLTRAQRQAQTRSQLLATAREIFLRDGYAATSVERVAEAAHFSKGAVYSNFRSKDELCVAVLDEIRADRMVELAGLVSAPTTQERLEAFEKWAARVIGDPEWTMLELEFAVRARHDPSLRERSAATIHALTHAAAAAVSTAAADAGVSPAMPAQELGTALLCLGVGLGLFRMIDPEIPVSALVNTLRALGGLPQPDS